MEATSTERWKQAGKQASKQARVPTTTEMTKRSLSDVIRRSNAHESEEAYSQMEDLLRCILTFDPAVRITPSDALRHPFLAV